MIVKDSRKKCVRWGSFKVAVLSFLILLLQLPVLPILAAEIPSGETIKVGYYYDGDFLKKAPGGIYEGYDVEYLYEIAKYTNWKYEFVDFDGFESAFHALERGEIDLIPNLFKFPDREKKFLFSEEDMGKLYITLIVPDRDTTHSYNDYDALAGMKVGILSASVDGEGFRYWDAEKKLHSDIVEMSSMEELVSALDSGELDAVAFTYMGPSMKHRIVAEFDPEYMYFGMPKDRIELMEQLNDAMNQILVKNPEFKLNLNKKYISTCDNRNNLIFTKEELNYIKQSDPVTVVVSSATAPFSFVDRDGTIQGAIPDLINCISEMSGLKFQLITADTENESILDLQNNRAQIIGGILENQPLMAHQGIRLTDPYMKMSMNEIVHKGTKQVRSIAVCDAALSVYGQARERAGLTAERNIVRYSSPEACMDALEKKDVDAAFCSTYFLSYLLNHSRDSKYAVTALSGYSSNICMGVSMQEKTQLFSILNKCLQCTDDSMLNEMVLKYSMDQDDSLTAVINRTPAGVILICTLVLLAAIVALMVALLFLRKHARKEKILIAQQEKIRQEAQMNAHRMEFFGAASHDMRTPLNAILGFTNLAKSAKDLAVIREFLLKIEMSGKLMLNLINDTLEVAKTDSKEFALRPVVVDSLELIEEVIVPIRAAAEAKKVILDVDFTRIKMGYIYVDKLYFQKIFLNLLSNAVKFTPAGGKVYFVIQYQNKDGASPEWKATIRDNGIGISREFIPKIFELFAQENSNVNHAEPGTGIGLFIVKRLVDSMNGKIGVSSEKGQGTEFTVTLPMKAISNYEPLRRQGKNFRELEGKKILLCEDNKLNMEITVRLLEKKKMRVICAKEGAEGVAEFKNSEEYEFAAILMDIRMPGMNGFEAAKAIRGLQRRDAAEVPIIAVSADAFKEDIAKSKESGMNAHIAKPIDPERLYSVLLDVFTERGKINDVQKEDSIC